MSDVRANSGVPVLAQFVGPTTPSACAPLVVDSATGIIYSWKTGDVIVPAGSSGTVTSVSVATANGFSGTVANATSTPAITIVAGAITPTTVNALTLASQAVGFTVAGGTTSKTLTVPLDASVSGTNTGDQTTVTTATNQSGGTVSATTIVASSTITPSQTHGIVGTTTNNNADAGSVGEYIESVVASGAPVSLTNGVAADMTSISLTAGDWDVDAIIKGNTGGSVTISWVRCSLSTTTATYNDLASFANESSQTSTNIGAPAFGIPPYRFLLTGTTTIYATVQIAFAVGTIGAYGTLRARRIR